MIQTEGNQVCAEVDGESEKRVSRFLPVFSHPPTQNSLMSLKSKTWEIPGRRYQYHRRGTKITFLSLFHQTRIGRRNFEFLCQKKK